MKRLALILFVLLSLAVVEETPIKDVVTSPETFALCKAVDIASTAYLLSHGGFIESNPIVAATMSHGYFPIIAISVGIYFLLKHFQDPVATGIANVATCGVAVHNLLLIP